MSATAAAEPPIRRVLVTGAGGFIGRAVARALAADGMAVIAHLGPPGGAATSPGPGMTVAHADIDDSRSMLDLTEGVDAVVHLAGPPSVAGSFHDPAGYARAHCLGTATILAACRAHGVRRLVHVSSAEVYGRPQSNPVPEDAPFAPRSPYAAMKVAAEDLIRTCATTGDLRTVVLRPFSVIGPPVAPHSVLGTILRQAFEQGTVAVQAPEIVRDYVFVEDVADAIRAALLADTVEMFRVFNVGTGIGTSVRDLAHSVLTRLGARPVVGLAGSADRRKAADIMELVADPGRAAAELGWRARLSLDAALGRIMEDYRRQLVAVGDTCAS